MIAERSLAETVTTRLRPPVEIFSKSPTVAPLRLRGERPSSPEPISVTVVSAAQYCSLPAFASYQSLPMMPFTVP